ncbi:MAG: DUF5676 family membrane protein [Nanoarchaeota archaeon]|nr:DUF5676 family membrane protein [Nanoarchaeota archaeon]
MTKDLAVLRVANTLAVTTAVIYLVCILAVWIAPVFTMFLGNYLFHGIDISRLVVARNFGYSLITLITGTIAGWLTGALFAIFYNRFK